MRQKYTNRMCIALKRILALMLALLMSGTAYAAAREPETRQGFMLDTVISISLYDGGNSDVLAGVFELCRHYEELLSRTIATSDVCRINAAEGRPVRVADDTAELLGIALKYAEMSDGVFDPTIEPLSALWNIGSEHPAVPDARDIAKALKYVDWQGVTLKGDTVTLASGMGVDLGGIAKGYIADKLRDYLVASGVKSAIINLGGNVLTIGSKSGAQPFIVGIRTPFAENPNDIKGACRAADMSVVTSGIYERYFTENGRLYHHILDTATGYPVANDIHSVTILSPDSTEGDALATICFASGVDRGLELVNALDGVEAIYCMADGSLIFSEGAGQFWLDPDEL